MAVSYELKRKDGPHEETFSLEDIDALKSKVDELAASDAVGISEEGAEEAPAEGEETEKEAPEEEAKE